MFAVTQVFLRMVRGLEFFLLLSIYLMTSCSDISKSISKDYLIPFKEDTIYVKARAWGLTGDHVRVVFSPISFESTGFDSSKCIIYYEPTIYYRQNGDSLMLISTTSANIPNSFGSIKIKENLIKELKEIKQYKDTYKSYGLNRISIYD